MVEPIVTVSPLSTFRLQKESTPWVFAAGGISGMLSWAITYPQDVIKSRIQADKFGSQAKYKGYIHCLKIAIEKDGHAILTRGMASSLIRYFYIGNNNEGRIGRY